MWTRLVNRGSAHSDFFHSQLHNFLREFDTPHTNFGRHTATAPYTNMYDNGDHFTLQAEVPGLSKEEIEIKIQGNYLELSGNRKAVQPEGYKAHRIEQRKTAFTRSFTLQEEVDVEKIEATLDNGMLTLTLPKMEAAKARQISIN